MLCSRTLAFAKAAAGRRALALLLLLSGCAGQLKAAMTDHAKSTLAVADTLSKAAEAIKCDAAQGADACKAAVAAIGDQVKALRDGAERLNQAAK